MTYDELVVQQTQILAECKIFMKDLRLQEFNAKMQELIALQDAYIKEREEKKNRTILTYV